MAAALLGLLVLQDRPVLAQDATARWEALNGQVMKALRQGASGQTIPLGQEALALASRSFGDKDPRTLASLGNLAVLLQDQGRLGEAEPLAREALQAQREVLGPRHPDTLTSLNNLALLLRAEGRLGEVEPLLREALQAARDPTVLGPAHPSTLLFQLNLVGLLAAQGRVLEAVRLQQAMEPQVLAWLGAELYSTEAASVRQGLVASQSTYQDVALSLALLPGAPREAAELAASAVLRFKGLATEEEAYLAGIVRRGKDDHVRALATEVAALHNRLAHLFQAGGGPEVNALAEQLDAKERELGRASRAYSQTLRVRNANLQDLRAVLAGLPAPSALLEVRAYRPVDFKAGRQGEPRWAGVLVTADGEIQVRDLGSVAEGAQAVRALLQASGPGADEAAGALHAQLLQPFAAELAGVERLYVAPDGVLYLVNVSALRGADGQRLLATRDVRLVQTGRDLLREAQDRPARGLVALGGIAFDLAPGQPAPAPAPAPASSAAPGPIQQAAAAFPALAPGAELAQLRQRAADTLRAGFKPLPGSKDEVEAIARAYRLGRRDEPEPLVLEDTQASKARLLALAPPRVLHLATHGFYWGKDKPADRPMLLAGIALAGANQALKGGGQDGILYAIEAQDLNLEGTELVVLSACETAQGQVDYGEGVSGLVRALRTAGARNVLVSLRNVSDQGAAAFMRRFYHHWLAQGRGSDPAAALRAAQREQLRPNTDPANPGPADPSNTDPGNADPGNADQTWTSFVLIGG